MVRKLVGFSLATAGGLLLVGSVFGADRVKEYGQTGQRIIQEKLDEAAGTGTKLEVLKTHVQQLDAEVAHLRRDVTTRQVELDAARARVTEDEASIERQKKVLAHAADLLDEGKDVYEIAGHRYARAVVEDDARAKLEACTAAESAVGDERKIVQVREKTLEVAKQLLERASKRRTELASLVHTLEARLSQLKAKKELAAALDTTAISPEVQGELARAEKLVKEIEQKIDTEDRLVDERLARKDVAAGTIDYDKKAEPSNEDTARAIRAHLAGPAKTVELH
ncbi:MAG TPA: hypothetical protein VFF73_22610 [Planctomycetota bacterium]|nr:hypothetical protein [Planctomycetota bacterium]